MNKHGGYTGDDSRMLDFSININPLGTPPRLKYDIISELDNIGRYPDLVGEKQCQRIADELDVPRDCVILGNGGIDLIYLYAQAMAEEGASALIIVPTFNEYRRALAMYGWDPIIEWEVGILDEFRIEPDLLVDLINKEKPKTVFLCNPNNPTGMAYSPSYLATIFDRCDPDTQWFIDESFIDFSSKESLLDLLFEKQYKMILLRSMTKFFGIPGLRLGYAVGHPDIIGAMEIYRKPWSVNSLALSAVDTLLSDRKFILDSRSYMKKERHRVFINLSKIKGIHVYPSAADFHLCSLKSGSAIALNEGLNVKGINIRTCEDFSGLDKRFFRIAVKKKDENDRLIQALREVVN